MPKITTIQNNVADSMVSLANKNWEKLTAGNYEAAGIEKCAANFTGYVGRTFDNVLPNISIKSQYGQSDYDYYRQNEATPKNPKDIVEVCMRACKKEGLVRNIVDLMSEFACKGVSIVHPDKRQERFGKEWFKYVNGEEVSERFLNLLYKAAHVPISITHGKVPLTIEKRWSSVFGLESVEPQVQLPKIVKRRMPLSYTFLNPLSIEPIAPELSAFTGTPLYGLLITHSLIGALQKARTIRQDDIQDLINQIPDDIKNAINKNVRLIPLTNDNFSIYFYKKDDWETFATPMVYSVIPDIVSLEKMKLADRSALDGAISNIRLWKLGHLTDNPQTCLIPTKSMINKLRAVLANNVGGGTMDLVWGPDIDFKESNTQVHHFLGIEKYEPVYKSIYEGLGVPSSLAGGEAGGFNNSFVQMQTFIERLEYGRSVLLKFWNKELKKVQLAMGYKKPFKIMFDQISLGDENALKQILLGLVDRNIMSVETLLNKFNCFSDIEKERIKREYRERQKDNYPDKASPFPTTTDEMKKTILNQGGVAPSELGMNLKPKKDGEKTHLEHQFENQSELEKLKIKNKPKVINPNGRPKGKTDTKTRKKRAVKPNVGKGSDFVSTFIWANSAQKKISDIITPLMVAEFGKSDVRALTTKEFECLEAMKFNLLSNIEPNDNITNEKLLDLTLSSPKLNPDMLAATKVFAYQYVLLNDKQPSLDEIRQMQSSAYSLYFEADSEIEEDEEVTI